MLKRRWRSPISPVRLRRRARLPEHAHRSASRRSAPSARLLDDRRLGARRDRRALTTTSGSSARARRGHGLVNAPVQQVAIGPQVSYFAGIVAASLPSGAEVVGYENDFPSLLYPFIARGDLDVRLLPSLSEPGRRRAAARPTSSPPSAVQFTDGRGVCDADALTAPRRRMERSSSTRRRHAAGCQLDASRFDVLIAGAYKWLLSPRGTAFMSARPEVLERLSRRSAGWYASEDPWGAGRRGSTRTERAPLRPVAGVDGVGRHGRGAAPTWRRSASRPQRVRRGAGQRVARGFDGHGAVGLGDRGARGRRRGRRTRAAAGIAGSDADRATPSGVPSVQRRGGRGDVGGGADGLDAVRRARRSPPRRRRRRGPSRRSATRHPASASR